MSIDREWYAEQSWVTDPGACGPLLDALPGDAGGLQKITRGLVIHYRAGDPLAHGVPRERLREIDTRYADRMLARLDELAPRPLSQPRTPAERLVGCCRDFTVLFLAMARRAGLPARARVGFATYFAAGHHIDHEVAELWDPAEERWRLVDAELGDNHRDPNDGERVDPLDVPRDRSLVGGAAWRACRAGKAAPASFVVAPEVDHELLRGWPYLAHNVIHDLAALNRDEMLLWDGWGLLDDDTTTSAADAEALLDRIAAVTAGADPDLADVRRLYADPAVCVPASVTSHDPLGGPPRSVRLRDRT